MSDHSDAETSVKELNTVPMADVGHVLTVGFQGVIFGLLDVAAAIREQTKATRTNGAAGLTASDDAKCTEIVGDDEDEEDEEGAHECGQPSRFVVERSDGDPSYGSGGGTEEACEAHLASVVAGMMDGDTDVRAVVSIRWDA